jgi:hypothetical protein
MLAALTENNISGSVELQYAEKAIDADDDDDM